MKIDLKIIFLVIFFVLIAINIYLFTQSLFLSENINKLEKETQRLKKLNLTLEKKLYLETSLSRLRKKAKAMGFVENIEPLYLENLKYAFNQ